MFRVVRQTGNGNGSFGGKGIEKKPQGVTAEGTEGFLHKLSAKPQLRGKFRAVPFLSP